MKETPISLTVSLWWCVTGSCEGGVSIEKVAASVDGMWQQYNVCGSSGQSKAHTRRPGTGPKSANRARRLLHSMDGAGRPLSNSISGVSLCGILWNTAHVTCDGILWDTAHSIPSPMCSWATFLFSSYHWSQRLMGCHDILRWTDGWCQVVFSDRTCFCLGRRSDGHTEVSKHHREWCVKAHRVDTWHYGPQGAVVYHASLPLVIIQDSVFVCTSTWILSSTQLLSNGIFQHVAHNTSSSKYPARSLDWSPMAHVWNIIIQHLTSTPRSALAASLECHSQKRCAASY